MQFKRFTMISFPAVLVALSFAAVARAQDAGKLLEGRQELDVVIAAIRAVVPEGLLYNETRWLCRPTSLDPECHLSRDSLNDRYGVGSFKAGRLFA